MKQANVIQVRMKVIGKSLCARPTAPRGARRAQPVRRPRATTRGDTDGRTQPAENPRLRQSPPRQPTPANDARKATDRRHFPAAGRTTSQLLLPQSQISWRTQAVLRVFPMKAAFFSPSQGFQTGPQPSPRRWENEQPMGAAGRKVHANRFASEDLHTRLAQEKTSRTISFLSHSLPSVCFRISKKDRRWSGESRQRAQFFRSVSSQIPLHSPGRAHAPAWSRRRAGRGF